ASITIVKELHPDDDPGLFYLQIDGTTAGTGGGVDGKGVGDGGTTGTVAVDTGERTVGESGASGTALRKYDIQIVCTNGTKSVAEGTGATLKLTVKKDQSIICTITNTRKEAKPVSPVLECVAFANGAPSVAYWGYRNDNDFPVTLPIGDKNKFTPGT